MSRATQFSRLASFFLGASVALFCAVLLVPGSSLAAGEAASETESQTAANDLVEASIRHHDPAGVWGDARLLVDLQEKRPDGTVRISRLEIDNGTGRFEIMGRHEVAGDESTRAGGKLSVLVDGGQCEFSIDGREPTPEEIEARRLTCDRWTMMRNYYTYLWGMPMKLRDPGTRIDPVVVRTEFEGQNVDAVRVTYDEAVGEDIWYFYFDPNSHRLVGMRFYHDESKNDGEYLVAEGETRAGSLSLIRDLSWFVNADDEHLGKDTLAGALLRSGE